MLDKATVREIAARYAEEVKKVLSPDAVILFGSYVNGNPHEWSDIDIAIVINGFQGNWLETASMLCSLTRRVSIDIEPHLLDETCDKSGFVGHVIKTGEVIYRAA
jgi:predicted nucleotidyltransferase